MPDETLDISEDGRGKVDMTERIRKRRQAVKRAAAEEAGHLTKTIPVPLKPGEYVPGA